MAVGFAAIGVQSALRRGDHKGAILDGARPQQHMPMRLTGRHRKRGRNGK